MSARHFIQKHEFSNGSANFHFHISTPDTTIVAMPIRQSNYPTTLAVVNNAQAVETVIQQQGIPVPVYIATEPIGYAVIHTATTLDKTFVPKVCRTKVDLWELLNNSQGN